GRTILAPNSQYRLKVLKCLLEHGADPNAITLAEACLRGDADIITLLLDYGANANDRVAMDHILERLDYGANANDRVAMDHILERLPLSTGRRHVDWLKKLQLLLHAGAPTDVAGLSAVTKEHPWVLE